MKPIHHGGKMGDLVLALPAIRAYARLHGPIDLVTSPLCIPIVPLLWDCPYIESIEVDNSQIYEADGKVLLQWEYFKNGEGINLSPQPAFRQEVAPFSMPPYSYSDCYSMILGVSPQYEDYMIFPALVNHRRWFDSHEVFYKGVSQKKRKTVVIAPEAESVPMAGNYIWDQVISGLKYYGYEPVIIKKKGTTTIPTAARMIAEADALIGAHSFPMQLAARIEVPTVCLQDMVFTLDRANPMKANVKYVDPKDWVNAVQYVTEMGKECVC